MAGAVIGAGITETMGRELAPQKDVKIGLIGLDTSHSPAFTKIVNDPANPNNYWRYRMHITLETLIQQDEFNKELSGYVEHSGR